MKVRFCDIHWETDNPNLPKNVIMDVPDDSDPSLNGARILRETYKSRIRGFDFDIVVPFNCLCLGAKFEYLDAPDQRTWVKIHANLIAEWNKDQITTHWIGQSVCCFNDEDKLNELVIARDLKPHILDM